MREIVSFCASDVQPRNPFVFFRAGHAGELKFMVSVCAVVLAADGNGLSEAGFANGRLRILNR